MIADRRYVFIESYANFSPGCATIFPPRHFLTHSVSLVRTALVGSKPDCIVSKSLIVSFASQSPMLSGNSSGKNVATLSLTLSLFSPTAIPIAAAVNTFEQENSVCPYSARNGLGCISPITFPWRSSIAPCISVASTFINESNHPTTASDGTPCDSGVALSRADVCPSASPAINMAAIATIPNLFMLAK